MLAFATSCVSALRTASTNTLVSRAPAHVSRGCFTAASRGAVAAGSAAPAPAAGRRAFAVTTTSMATQHKEGDTVPPVTFKTRVRVPELEAAGEENPFDWKDTTSEDYFKGKRTVLFALPGAFTPTCSNTHLPGYERDYDTIKSLGVDEIYCLSVNDAYVSPRRGASCLPQPPSSLVYPHREAAQMRHALARVASSRHRSILQNTLMVLTGLSFLLP
jgi:Redoxin